MAFPADVKQAARVLTKSPAFALAAVLVLALGIGANTAVFSIVDGVLLRPLPYPDEERLVQLWHTPPPPQFPAVRIFALSAGSR
jgi:putative ABC transport system permease protein